MPKLYDYVLSDACYKVRLMLSLLGISYEIVAIDFYPGREHEGAAFRAINREGDLPVLEDGPDTLRDAQAILVHLARKYGAEWLPPSRTWLDFAASDLQPLAQARLTNLLGLPGDLETLRRAGRTALRRLDDHLADRQILGQDWIEGDRVSIADIALFPHVALSHDAHLGLEEFPALNLWQRRVRKLPNFVGMPGIPDYC